MRTSSRDVPAAGRAWDLRDNRLARALPADELRQLRAIAARRRADPGQDLYGPRAPRAVCFPLDGAIDLLLSLHDGLAAEAALIGREGLVGFPVAIVAHGSAWEALALLPTEFAVVPADAFADLLDRAPHLRRLVERYSALLLESSVLLSGCAHFHELEPRLARLLLQVLDHDGAELRVGQDLLARVLGSYRPTITIALHRLRDRGLIEVGRLRIGIRDRPGLERTACTCYDRLREANAAFAGELERLP